MVTLRTVKIPCQHCETDVKCCQEPSYYIFGYQSMAVGKKTGNC